MGAEVGRLLLLLALCGGGAAWLVFRNLRRTSLGRLQGIVRSESASAAVEMPFVLLVLVTLVTVTWQVVFIMTAYLYMDHVAHVTARSAAVVVPERYKAVPGVRSVEVENILLPPYDTRTFRVPRTKLAEIRSAAVMACVPISGPGQDPSGVKDYIGIAPGYVIHPALSSWGKMTGTEDRLREMSESRAFLRRYAYANHNTDVRVVIIDLSTPVGVAPVADPFFAGGETLTIEVIHKYELQVPYARNLLGRVKPVGGRNAHVYELRSVASYLNEGYLGATSPNPPEGLPPGAGR